MEKHESWIMPGTIVKNKRYATTIYTIKEVNVETKNVTYSDVHGSDNLDTYLTHYVPVGAIWLKVGNVVQNISNNYKYIINKIDDTKVYYHGLVIDKWALDDTLSSFIPRFKLAKNQCKLCQIL